MNQTPSKIHFIFTGGTIDSKALGANRDIIFEHSVIPGYLQSLKSEDNFEFSEVCMKDSRDITTKDREAILAAIEKSSAEKIIVTHGTFTMVDTGNFLKNNLKIANKTVVVTGSFIPLKFENSDARENLAFAISSLNSLGSGVYIAINDRIFDPDKAQKDNVNNRFYSSDDK